MYQAPRGTADILPEQQAYWRYIESKAIDICQRYGYQRIDTPVFEDAQLFIRSIGLSTDIVTKEMYIFKDKGGNELTLKPEGTAPVCRAYLEHGLFNAPQPVKLFYFSPIFRYERPQAGRYREHHQFGCEAFGDADASLDAEVIDMARQFFRALGLSELTLHLNSIGCKKCRPTYLEELKKYYASLQPQLCDECRARRERNPLRLLDCKQPGCQPLAASAPGSADHLCPECAQHFDRLKKHLNALELPFELDHRLVRGLDYYTRTVFEMQPKEEKSQSAVGGGGRYDDLLEELGGKPTPAIGFATGMERIVFNLTKEKVAIPGLPGLKVFIAYTSAALQDEAVKLAATLRRDGMACLGASAGKSLKSQMRQANALGLAYAIIIADEEWAKGAVIFRDMTKAEQETVPLSGLAQLLAQKKL